MQRHYQLLIVAPAFWVMSVSADVVRITHSPRPFFISPPPHWVAIQPTRPNTRVRYATQLGVPLAECMVTVKEYPGLAPLTQNQLDELILEKPSMEDLKGQYSAEYNNVEVLGVGNKWISGYAGQIINLRYSVGTQSGELWSRGIFVTFATTPGIIWVIGCGGMAFNPVEAQRNYSYWQSEILKFVSTLQVR